MPGLCVREEEREEQREATRRSRLTAPQVSLYDLLGAYSNVVKRKVKRESVLAKKPRER